MGIISPSINHLPLSYTLDESESKKIIYFSSGWEVQEALIAGRLDVAIMPFSYAWNAASRGYPIRIVSFFERESDGIVAHSKLNNLQDLDNAKIGLLKASTVELLMDDLAGSEGFRYQAVYFRTPNEMVSALQVGEVDAIVAYVPVIQKISGDFNVLHWFGDSHPKHPCCDIVVNKKNMTDKKIAELKGLISRMHCVLLDIASDDQNVHHFAQDRFQLDQRQSSEALTYTKFITGLDESGKALQRRLISIAVQKGYQKHMLRDDEIYWELP